MLNLFPRHKFLFLLFLLGHYFLLCNCLFWLWNNLFRFDESHVNVVKVNPAMSSIIHWHILGALLTLICSITKEYTSKPLRASSLSAFLNTCRKEKSKLFSATDSVSSPTVWPRYTYLTPLEWPTWLLSSDTIKTLGNFSDIHTLDSLETFTCDLKRTWRLEPLDLHNVIGFSGSRD